MAGLNRDKCFTLAEQVQAEAPGQLALKDDYLQQLAELCCQKLSLSADASEKFRQDFKRHVGPDSTYNLKKDLLDNLQTIYRRLTTEGEHAASPSEQRLIVDKLHEGIEHCTPGFHDRVSDVTRGFHVPNSLDDLLGEIRHSIVDAAAHKQTDDVHAHNRFFVVASNNNYGVKPLNPDDIYRGAIADYDILPRLREAFEKNYKPTAILSTLSADIQNIMRNQFGYKGLNVEGYKIGEYGKCLAYLKNIFGAEEELDASEYLVMDDDYKIIDLNWHKINQTLFQVLDAEHYIHFNDSERQCLTQLFEEQAIQAAALFVGDNALIRSTPDLIHLLSFVGVDNPQGLQQLIVAYLSRQAASQHLDILCEISAAMKHRLGFAEVLQGLPNQYEYAIALLGTDDDSSNLLMQALQNKKYQPYLLELLGHLDDDLQKEVLSAVDSKNENLLFLAIRHQPAAFLSLVEKMKQLMPDKMASILGQCNRYDNNMLMLALDHQPSAVQPILNAMQALNDDALVKQIFMQKDEDEDSALALAFNNQPKNILMLLNQIEHLPPPFRAEIFAQCPVDAWIYRLNALPDDTAAAVTEKMQVLMPGLKEARLERQLNQYWDSLRLAIPYRFNYWQERPASVESILSRVERCDTEMLRPLLLTKIDDEGHNALMLALRHGNDSVTLMMQKIRDLGPEAMGGVLKVKNHQGENALMLAIHRQSEVLPALLEHMQNLDEASNSEILSALSAENWSNLLKYALRQPGILPFFKQQFVFLNQDLKTQIFLNKNDDSQNILMNVLAHQPEDALALLNQIEHLDPQLRAEIFAQYSVQTWIDVLMPLANDIAEPVLEKMQALMPALMPGLREAQFQQQLDQHWESLRQAILGRLNYMQELPPSVESILSRVEQRDAEMLRPLLLTKIDDEGHNALMFALRHGNDSVTLLMQRIQGLGPESMGGVLKVKNHQGENALMLAIRHRSEQLLPLIEQIKSLDDVSQKAILAGLSAQDWSILVSKTLDMPDVWPFVEQRLRGLQPDFQVNIFRQKVDAHGWHSILMHVLAFQPESLIPLLDVLSHLPAPAIEQILRQVPSVLNMLAGSNPLMLSALLDKIKHIDPQVRARILMRPDDDTGYNVVRYAARSDAESLEIILNHMKQLPPEYRGQLNCYENITSMMRRSNSRAFVIPVLKHLDLLTSDEQQNLLRQVRAEGVFTHDLWKDPELIQLLFSKLKIPEGHEAQKLMMDLSVSLYEQALKQALSDRPHHPHGLTKLLTIMTELPTEVQMHLYQAQVLKPIEEQHVLLNHKEKTMLIEAEIGLQLGRLWAKVEKFKLLNNANDKNSPYQVAHALHDSLKENLSAYKKDKDIKQLEARCGAAIDTASPVLSTHRGIKQVFIAFLSLVKKIWSNIEPEKIIKTDSYESVVKIGKLFKEYKSRLSDTVAPEEDNAPPTPSAPGRSDS